jgi:hypothetical protein
MNDKPDHTKIVDLTQVRQARQRAASSHGLRELDDEEMELVGILMDRSLALKVEQELIERYWDLIEAGGNQLDDAYMEIARFCDLIPTRR